MMNGKYDSPLYDECRRWIEKKREKNVSWETIQLGGKNTIQDLQIMLDYNHETNDWPELSVAEWNELIEQMKFYEDQQESFIHRGNDGALFDRSEDNGFTVPQSPYSGWQMYKTKLRGKNWKDESLKMLEDASVGILRRLKKDTRESGPVKGLVIGHVQSGKTANMEALMEMAADYGWNMFIILSGTIENLRQQTLKRMLGDFNPGVILTGIALIIRISIIRIPFIKTSGLNQRCVILQFA